MRPNILIKRDFLALLRSIYMRYKVLQAGRQLYLKFRFLLKIKLKSYLGEKVNLSAIQVLSGKRFAQTQGGIRINSFLAFDWPPIDISVVSYNSAGWITNFFLTLSNQLYPTSKINLFVVDHGSSDNSVALIRNLIQQYRAKFRRIELLEQSNLGFGAGHDYAIKRGQAIFFLVTNFDVEFYENTICEAVSVALCDIDGAVASWEMRQVPYEHPKYYDPVTLETNWSSHACVLIRRSAYEKVGGYDPEIFMYTEDVELSYRFRSFGYCLKYVPQAVIKHITYETPGQIKPTQYMGSAVGNVYLRFRYGNKNAKILGIFLFGSRFLMRSPFPGAKISLLKNAVSGAYKIRHFLDGKGPELAYFPFRGFDYEFIRDGAFYQISKQSIDVPVPVVTVIVRTYEGRAMFLSQAIRSVFNQTYRSIDLVVVEDGGNSQKAMVASMSAPENVVVQFISNPKLGRSAAGNTGLLNAKGEYVMFLDDDDLIFADHIEILIAELRKDKQISAAYSLALEVRTEVDMTNETYSELEISKPAIFDQVWNYDVLCDHNFIPIQSILFKKELYQKHGGFDVDLDQLEDWNLWLRYGYKETFKFVPKTTSLFRSPANISQRNARHSLLHDSYHLAKHRASRALERVNK